MADYTEASVETTIFNHFSDNGVDLSPQEITIINQMIASSTAQVSGNGGVVGINVPGGYHLVGTTTAGPTGTINLAGIYDSLGLSFGDIMLALTLGNVDVSPATLEHILNSIAGSGATDVPTAEELRDRQLQIISFTQPEGEARGDFIARLDDALRDNRNRILARFGATHPNIANISDSRLLPSEVLEYLIALMREA